MKKIMLFAAACVALAACTKNIDTTTPEIGKATSFEKGQKVTFSVSAGDQTKATSSLDGTTGAVDFKWETGDKIKVTVGSESAEFTLKSGAGESTATFEGTMPGDGTTFNVQFPATTPDLSSQTYVEGQALPHNMMLATASGCTINDSFSLNAQNATLRLNLYGTGIKVTKIVVKQEGGSNTYTLDCGTGAAVGATSDAAKPFFVVVPASTFKFTAEVYDDSETPQLIASFTPSEAQTFSVGKSLNMPGKEVIDPSKYLCFTCTGGNVAIGMTKKNKIYKGVTTYAPDISLLYYTDQTGWQDFKIGVGNGSDSTSIALASGEKVYFRAKTTNDSLAVSSSAYNYFTTTTTDNGKVDVSGNIMTLLNGDNPGTTLAHTNTFTSIFKGCTSIQNASGLSLPATSLVKNCYAHMFNGCTALEKAPALPATSLAYSCYINMLFGCTALETAPALPATSLADLCYCDMFNGCSKLSSVTMLATDVSANCFTNWLKNAGTDESVTSRTVYIAKGMGSKEFNIPTSWTKVEILPGVFSVSGDKKVRFSKGNLYWNGSAWHLETNQYDYPSTWSTSHVGHFYWSKTASVAYASTYSDASAASNDYFFCGEGHELTVDGQGGLYALSNSELTYLINTRTNANSLKKTGVSVAGKLKCLIIAPDGYTGTIATSYDAAAWTAAESQGLVCLPAAGKREGSSFKSVGGFGEYWLSTPDGNDCAYGLGFNGVFVNSGGNSQRLVGRTVRLVSSAQ